MNDSSRSVFLSHSSKDSSFVVQVGGFLARCFDHVFCYEDHQKVGNFVAEMQVEVASCEVFVFFVGEGTEASYWQKLEHGAALTNQKVCIPVQLPGANGKWVPFPQWASFQGNHLAVRPKGLDAADAKQVAAELCAKCGIPWQGKDGLPVEPNLFGYEKAIIDFFEDLRDAESKLDLKPSKRLRDKILKGCPAKWPSVERRNLPQTGLNILIPDIGDARKHSRYVRVSALQDAAESEDGRGAKWESLAFPEAGPRTELCFPIHADKPMKIAVMVVGGIAPGINAVIDGIVQRHYLYAEKAGYAGRLQVVGLYNGVQAFEDWDNSHCLLLCDAKQHPERGRKLETPQHAHEGGSILGTCRDDDLLKSPLRDEKLTKIVRRLDDYDILYVIGGDGGMRMAHAIQNFAKESRSDLSVVGIPKTMDNDILWVWQSFGFMSAVEKAREVIEHIHTEITSNPRLGIVQLFGSVSGFVVSHAVLAGSTPSCYLALVPEVEFQLREVAEYLKEKLEASGPIPKGLVVMAETALPTDALDILDELAEADRQESMKLMSKLPPEPLLTRMERDAVQVYLDLRNEHKTLSGQTSDHLRSACLKIVSKGLELLLKRKSQRKGDRWDKLRVVTNEPRHIIRAIPPSCLDIITGRRLGGLAVDNAMAGYTDFMISQWLTEFVLVPLSLVVLGRKQIHRKGIFWKSVLAKTGSWKCFEAVDDESIKAGSSKPDKPSKANSKPKPKPKSKRKSNAR